MQAGYKVVLIDRRKGKMLITYPKQTLFTPFSSCPPQNRCSQSFNAPTTKKKLVPLVIPHVALVQPSPYFTGAKDVFIRIGVTQQGSIPTSKIALHLLEHPKISFGRKGKIKGNASADTTSPQVASSAMPMAPFLETEKLINALAIPYRYLILLRYGKHRPDLSPVAAHKELAQAKIIALGDLHASMLKLVETAVVAGLIVMPEDIAQQFAKIMQIPKNENAADIPRYNQTQELITKMNWIGKDRSLILIGDVLSDRAPFSDELTLDLIERLSKQSPNAFIRMASNHDHHALQYMRDYELGISAAQVKSLLQAVTIARLKNSQPALYTKYFNYLKQSKLMYFDESTHTLFTHARVQQKHLQKLHEFLEDRETSETLPASSFWEKISHRSLQRTHTKLKIKKTEELKAFIERANNAYQQYIIDTEAGKVSKEDHKNWDKLLANASGLENLFGFLWAREPHQQSSELPFYPVVQALVHGHDEKHTPYDATGRDRRAKKFRIFNLDQSIRWFEQGTELGVSEWCENPVYIVR